MLRRHDERHHEQTGYGEAMPIKQDGIITEVQMYTLNGVRYRNNITSVIYGEYLFAVEVRYGGVVNDEKNKIINDKRKTLFIDVKKREVKKLIDAYRKEKELPRCVYQTLAKHLFGRIKSKLI